MLRKQGARKALGYCLWLRKKYILISGTHLELKIVIKQTGEPAATSQLNKLVSNLSFDDNSRPTCILATWSTDICDQH